MFPQTIIDQPIPLLEGGFSQATGSNSDPVISGSEAETPNTNVDTKFPIANVAQETISQSLNTETKRILGQYTFEQLGAIVIGLFSQGVSGQISISPDGIVAKNVNGDNTFSLNGATGNAIFKGTVEAAGFTIADETGLHSLNNFTLDGVIGTGSSTTSASFQDVSGASITFTLARSSRVLVFFGGDVANSNASGYTVLNLNINGTNGGFGQQAIGIGVVNNTRSVSTILTLPSGSNTLKLQQAVGTFGVGTASTFNAFINYIVLGI